MKKYKASTWNCPKCVAGLHTDRTKGLGYGDDCPACSKATTCSKERCLNCNGLISNHARIGCQTPNEHKTR